MTLIASPFGATSTAREVAAGHDLSGRTVVITGAASGIGVETARALAEAGAVVTLAVRNQEAGRAAAADIGRGTEVRSLDLSNLASVRAFAESWGEAPLDILINNAGVMACPFERTADGFEMQIGTNHFGHFALGRLLARSLERAAKPGRASRLVSLSSIGHRRAGVDFDDPNYQRRPYDKWEAYGQSKCANALFAVGFNRRFAGRGVTANAVMPGGIMTPLQRHMAREEMQALGWMDAEGNLAQGFKTPEQGASTSVWAAVGPELEGFGGRYLEDCAEAGPWTEAMPWRGVRDYALDPEGAERLWTLSEELTGART